MTPPRASSPTADRVYRLLLRAYPATFRARFETGMRDAFREDLARARSRGGAAALAFHLSAALGTLRAGLAERLTRPASAALDPMLYPESRRRALRAAWSFDWRDAYRSLRATPVVTIVAVLSLTLGIGANTALFSLLNGLLLKPLPVRDPARLVRVDNDFTNPLWEQVRDRRQQLFDDAFVWSSQRFNLSAQGETDPVDGGYASGGMFDVLGVHALVGRTFTPQDDARGGGADGPVAVVSYGFSQRRFGGAEGAVGQRLMIDRVPMTVIGVLPAEFFGPEVGRTADVIVPLGDEAILRGKASQLDGRATWWLILMARLKPGQTLEQATSALNAARPAIRAATLPDWKQEFLDGYLSDAFVIVPAAAGDSPLRARYQEPLTVILVVVGAVLLIACANIANLLLARAAARRRELSLRLALGASRARLARQLIAEGLLLSTTGAAFGLVFAAWSSRLLLRALGTPASAVFLDLSLDWRVLAFTTATAVAAALLFGVAPALGVSGLGPQDAIREQGRGVVGDRHALARGAFVVVQIALSLGLVVAAGLFARTFASLTSVPLGFDAESMLTVTVDVKQSPVAAAQHMELFERVRAAAAAVPGVIAASASVITPVSGSGWNTLVEKPGQDGWSRSERLAWVNGITPEWFRTYRMRLVAGREFTPDDRQGAPLVAVANQAFARHFFGDANPVGREIVSALGHTPAAIEIVGVVTDAVYRSQRGGVAPTLYVPLAQADAPASSIALTVRAAPGPATLVTRGVTEAVGRVEPRAALTFRTIDDMVRASVSRERLVAMLAGFFGGLALLLAALGLYGVTAYSVGRRRAEIGIRMALGATSSGVVRLVLTRLGWLLAAGVVAGAALSVWATGFVATLLFGVTARDPLTFVGAAIVLAAVAALAGWLPARRAARVDPLQALREG